MTKITNAQLRTQLVSSGITVDSTAFPDGGDALKVASAFLDALQRAQTVQNGAATAGERVAALVASSGLDQTIERDSQTYNVRSRSYTVSMLQQQLAGETFGPLQ